MSMPLNNTICSGILEEIFDSGSELERWTIGVILSAMAYGGILFLTLSYVFLLLKTSYDIPRRMRIFLLVYVTFMLAISTVYIIIIITALRTSVSKFSSGPNEYCSPLLDLVDKMNDFQIGQAGGFCITLASWGADGFMLWRCAILYDGVSPPRRIALNTILGFIAFMSLGSGLAFIIDGYGLHHFHHETFFFMAMTGTTIMFNLVTATLITFRILYFDRCMRKTVGLEGNNPYMTVIILCIESSALIVVFSSIYLILAFGTTNGSLIPLQLSVHVYVISPLLILYRVARGRTATVSQRPSENGPVVSSLHFAPPPPPPTSNNPISSSNDETC